MILAEAPDFGDIVWMMVEHTLICLVVVAIIVSIVRTVRPPLARVWQRSLVRQHLRAWWQTRPPMSKARAALTAGLIGNALVILFCVPLLRVPPGSGVKPMALPLFFIIIAAVTWASCRTTGKDAARPNGLWLPRFVGQLLCLTPLPAGVIAMNAFAAMRGLTFG
jgi:hypothetical protein